MNNVKKKTYSFIVQYLDLPFLNIRQPLSVICLPLITASKNHDVIFEVVTLYYAHTFFVKHIFGDSSDTPDNAEMPDLTIRHFRRRYFFLMGCRLFRRHHVLGVR